MKCKVLCFLFCVLFCFSSLSLSSSAGDEPGYIFTVDDLLDLGFYLAPNGSYVYSGNDDPFDLGISTFMASEKNYPDFDILSDIPWSTFPQYIKDILYMDCDDLSHYYPQEFKVPFVLVLVESSTVNVFVGINVGLGQLNNSYLSFSIFSVLFYPNIASNSSLYRFSYNYVNDTVNLNWTKQTPQAFGDTGYLNRMLSWNIGSDASVFDIYCSGANGVSYPWIQYIDSNGNQVDIELVGSISVPYNSSNENYLCGFLVSSDGFRSGDFLYGQNSAYPYCYFEYFSPPSQETINHETSKGIWETLKGIPEAIGEKIKGLFVPATGFFDLYVQDFRLFFQDRLGLLYELPEAVIDIFQQLADYEPATEGYGIDFPEVVMPILDNGEWYDKVLIEETRFEFDFLDEGPIATLYSMYRSVLWLTFIFMLINLIIRKANKVFGGGSG